MYILSIVLVRSICVGV